MPTTISLGIHTVLRYTDLAIYSRSMEISHCNSACSRLETDLVGLPPNGARDIAGFFITASSRFYYVK